MTNSDFKLNKKEIIYYNSKRREKNNLNKISMRKNLLDEEIEKKLLMSEEDYKNGRTKKAEDVFKLWKEKYGI